ncbi:hypothetical protein PSEUBRA_000650 [Kalmanozyma brasiliensis GHG001]|uniref:Uncharacterized protein n=1 Tax=Kalmanozyma brasiliensis (strain GHG001) TaxID=1365824 RepID=V5EVE0_KALBG|nr:uncharacterized protein PSEUBRA_000650 [Kalmanozyma brasiliensis GHG001]EST09440.1 hypothetical protein PSEUBRA_000650 [Kalmanozyma brasiliensis GHG001]
MSARNPSRETVAAPGSPTLSSTSHASNASTTATVIDSQPNPKSLVNLGKQLKYLSIGLVLTLYFQVYQHLSDALSLGILSSFPAKLALLSAVLLIGTVLIFGYIILLPARGYTVNYMDWRGDAHLGSAIPILTACIIFGWVTLLFTLSPVGAPAPPAQSIQQRLSQAAAYTGWDSLQSKIQSIPANILPQSSTSSGGWNKITSRLSGSNADKSWDTIASYLSLSPRANSNLQQYFLQLSARADDWAARNIKVIGWTGALLGSIGTYLFVFGAVGLVGFVAPDNRANKSKTF